MTPANNLCNYALKIHGERERQFLIYDPGESRRINLSVLVREGQDGHDDSL